MDPGDNPNGSRTSLRQPFIDTANALAFLYKQSMQAEREARDAGSRAAYMHIMQWAARKSRSNQPISAADVINFCTQELAQLPSHSPPTDNRLSHHSNQPASPPHDPHSIQQQLPSHNSVMHVENVSVEVADNQQHQAPAVIADNQQNQAPAAQTTPTAPVAWVARDDGLVSDIRKLNVNPRKRQRVDISDTFISACRRGDADGLIFSSDQGYLIRSQEESASSVLISANPPVRQGNTPPLREGRDTSEGPFGSFNVNEYAGRKAKNGKGGMYDKHRRK
eukprot:GFKZ01004440.1.p1 GENE.GFKZ01004440.1~~GFKZ01004440.1.p1  ORF type:complete len:279 (-),score=38.65 GFKZ01004440.1:528-1364(-)